MARNLPAIVAAALGGKLEQLLERKKNRPNRNNYGRTATVAQEAARLDGRGVEIWEMTGALQDNPSNSLVGGVMAILNSIPPLVIVVVESAGVCLLAFEVWMAQRVEEIVEGLLPSQRLQYLFTAQDFRGFWIERMLQRGQPPARVTEGASLLGSADFEKAVNEEWSEIAPEFARSTHRYERYTAPSVRLRRKISLLTGTMLILIATWLTFLREAGSPSNSTEHSDSSAAVIAPALGLTRHQLIPFPASRAEGSDPGITEDVCRILHELHSAQSGVAVVIGRHDPRPLTAAGSRRFGSNLSLAQRRAETIARLLQDSKTCSDSAPIEAIAIAVPNDRPVLQRVASTLNPLDEERRPDVLGLGIVMHPKR